MKEVRRYDFSVRFNSDFKLKLSMIQNEYAALFKAAIERFGGLLITDELNGVDIHRLQDITESLIASKFGSKPTWHVR
jgi:hypothetical protein